MESKTTEKPPPPSDALNTKQQYAFEQAIVERRSLFITGSAGTGKSHLLRKIVRRFRETVVADHPGELALVVTASSGTAAVKIKARTLHSWALGKDDDKLPVDRLIANANNNNTRRKHWNEVRVLIIDEISMVRAELMDKLDMIARSVRGVPDEPFGGIQVILVGDFCQLPPVMIDHKKTESKSKVNYLKAKRYEGTKQQHKGNMMLQRGQQGISTTAMNDYLAELQKQHGPSAKRQRLTEKQVLTKAIKEMREKHKKEVAVLKTKEGAVYAFESEVWKELFDAPNAKGRVILLTEVLRQKNTHDIQLLNRVRLGQMCSSDIFRLKNRHNAKLEGEESGINATYLHAYNKNVNTINQQQFDRVKDNQPHKYSPMPVVSWVSPRSSISNRNTMRSHMLQSGLLDKQPLELSVGCAVMFIRNLDVTRGISNGTQGKIVGFRLCDEKEIKRIVGEFAKRHKGEKGLTNTIPVLEHLLREEEYPLVSIDPHRAPILVTRFYWDWTSVDHEWTGYLSQLPLRLSWAMTIHKSQGDTIQRVRLTLDYSVRTPGQAYVALSRAPSINNISLASPFWPQSVIVDPKVVALYKSYEKRSETMMEEPEDEEMLEEEEEQ